MLLMDGIKFKLYVPEDEREIEEMVKEHSEEIFGQHSVYFDLKQKLKSASGVGSIPDGYVISLTKPFEWLIVEVELSKHPLHEHITNQLNKFMVGVRNTSTQKELVDSIYNEIVKDRVLKADVETMINSPEIKGFLYDLISKTPRIAVVIEETGDKVKEACDGLKVEPAVVEFKTFVREDDPNVHAHLFEPIPAVGFDVIASPGHETKWTPILVDIGNRFRKLKPEVAYSQARATYLPIPTGVSHIHYEWNIYGRKQKVLDVALHFETGDKATNEKWVTRLLPCKEELEKRLGEKVHFGSWSRVEGSHRWNKISVSRKIDHEIDDRTKTWAAETMAVMYEVLTPRIKSNAG